MCLRHGMCKTSFWTCNHKLLFAFVRSLKGTHKCYAWSFQQWLVIMEREQGSDRYGDTIDTVAYARHIVGHRKTMQNFGHRHNDQYQHHGVDWSQPHTRSSHYPMVLRRVNRLSVQSNISLVLWEVGYLWPLYNFSDDDRYFSLLPSALLWIGFSGLYHLHWHLCIGVLY